MAQEKLNTSQIDGTLTNANIDNAAAIAISKLSGGADGSASGYMKLGNFMIQWGIASVAINGQTFESGAISFPIAFKAGSTPVVTISTSQGENVTNYWSVGQGTAASQTNAQFTIAGRDGTSSRNATFYFAWHAIGLIA